MIAQKVAEPAGRLQLGHVAYSTESEEAWCGPGRPDLDGAPSRIWAVLHQGSFAGTLSAMDPLPPPFAFFSLLFSGWVNRQQQAVIDLEIAGITDQPGEAWMMPIARNLTDAGDGFLRGIQHIILDRDPLYTRPFGVCCATAASRRSSYRRGVRI